MKIKASPAPTSFMNVEVTAIPTLNTSGKVEYQTTFNPEKLVVHDADVVINYQLVDPTPAGVTFKKMDVKPENNEQFSAPSISVSGKLVTFNDANTKTIKMNVTLHFKDSDGLEFSVDPEVLNEPRPTALAGAPLGLMAEPEVPNEPRPH